MIEVEDLTKVYDTTRAVDDLSFVVAPGIVTGFLGPNGAGKSTALRLILGLDRPTEGHAQVNGRPVANHLAPLTEIGALLDAKAVHPKRSARNHLRALAATTAIPDRRVDEVLDLVGLTDVADQIAGDFSLARAQRGVSGGRRAVWHRHLRRPRLPDAPRLGAARLSSTPVSPEAR
jgi:ABC-2 type transport system ATP-binding protein